MPRVGAAPPLFREKCPGEPWSIWVHKEVEDFEMSSFGATAGFIVEGTPVEVLDRQTVTLREGPLAEEAVEMVRVRGSGETGRMVVGWTLARDIDETS